MSGLCPCGRPKGSPRFGCPHPRNHKPDGAPPKMPHFDGETYEPEKDQKRLSGLLGRVQEFMADGKWHTLEQIQEACGGSEASVSARIRDLRKKRFGEHYVQTKRIKDGLFVYRLADTPF